MFSYRTWNSDDEFFMVYKNIRVALDRVNVRTFIEKTGNFQEKDPVTDRVLPSVEFGIIKDRKYFVRFSSEEYQLPPDRESGKPQKRVHHLLWISSRPYQDGKPQVDLTPLYQGWSY